MELESKEIVEMKTAAIAAGAVPPFSWRMGCILVDSTGCSYGCLRGVPVPGVRRELVFADGNVEA